MSNFNTSDTTKKNTSDTVNYNFDNILVNSVSSPGDSGSLLSTPITIPNGSSITADLFFVKNSAVTNYKASNLYFYPLLHNNITGVTDGDSPPDGELVIKLNGSSSSDIAYACFFLKYDNNHIYSDIDKFKTLIGRQSSGGNSVNLNGDIGAQKYCIYYKANPIVKGVADNSKVTNVFIFPSPIHINSDTESLIKDASNDSAPFTINAPTSYEIITKNVAKINDDQIYIDCNLTGESEENIATYNIPINSAMSGEDAEMNYMKMTVNFFIFLIGLVFCYTAIPVLYKLTVIDRINLLDTESLRSNRLLGTDVLISIISVLFIIILFIYGTTKNNYKIQTAGMSLAVLYILSFCILQIKRTDRDYMTTNGVKLELYDFDINKLREIFPVISVWFEKVVNNMAAIVVMLGTFILLDIFLYIFKYIDWSSFMELSTKGSVVVLFLTICGIAMFTRIQSTKSILTKS